MNLGAWFHDVNHFKLLFPHCQNHQDLLLLVFQLRSIQIDDTSKVFFYYSLRASDVLIKYSFDFNMLKNVSQINIQIVKRQQQQRLKGKLPKRDFSKLNIIRETPKRMNGNRNLAKDLNTLTTSEIAKSQNIAKALFGHFFEGLSGLSRLSGVLFGIFFGR